MLFKKTLAGLLISVCSLSASANIYNLDTASNHLQVVSYERTPIDWFRDTFTFTVPDMQTGGSNVIAFDFLNYLNIYNLSVSPTASFTEASPLSFTPTYDPITNNVTGYTSNILTAGAYSFDVFGKITGTNGGIYAVNYTAGLTSGNGTVSTVPVPSSIWMLGSALAGLVSLGKRKTSV